MSQILFRSVLAASTAILLNLPALAAPDPIAFLEQRFRDLDLDKDGKLNAEEAKPVAAWVVGADANKDGLLTMDEIRDSIQDKIVAMIEARRGEKISGPDVTVDEKAPPMLEPKDSPREGPRLLKAGESGIGARIGDAALVDLDGKARMLSEFTAKRPAVIALVSTSCPVSKRSLPSLARLEKEYAARGVAFVLIAPTATDSAADLRAALKDAGFSAPCLRDPKNTFLATLGAQATTDTFLVDTARTLVYRGALDDQYGLGYSLDAPRHRYLADALSAMLENRAPAVAATEAPGCLLDLGDAKPATTDVTYHNRISRVVQANCLECHRAGGLAPFPLETHEQVVAKAGMIKKMVDRRLMPPWFAAAPAAGTHSLWKNDRALAARDKADFLAWLNAGKPEGEVQDAPLARTFPSDWVIGQPDAVVQIPNPIAVKAEGTMNYINVTVQTSFGEDRWVRGYEVLPTAREVVHHVLIFVQKPGQGRFEGEDDERTGFFAAYVPGNNHIVYPDGFAKLLPANTKVRFQIHYTPNGTATQDQVKLGLLFAKEPPKHIVRVAGIVDHRISIPPGAAHHPETGTIPVPMDVKILALNPHMHVRGSAFRYEVSLPDGSLRTLLEVPRYDFNWQVSCRYAEPPTIPRGSTIRATGWFDNSANNPANPDPTKTVRWGLQTSEEMMIGYVEYYQLDEKPPAPAPTASR
ncbi:MAG: redoxin family protein [Chthoniobacteraceae bacterium]